MERTMLEGLLEQVRLGKRAESSFNKEAWSIVLPKIQAVIVQTDENGVTREITQEKAAIIGLQFRESVPGKAPQISII